MKLTTSQKKTLAYIRENGPVRLDLISVDYSIRSVDALLRRGLLVEKRNGKGTLRAYLPRESS